MHTLRTHTGFRTARRGLRGLAVLLTIATASTAPAAEYRMEVGAGRTFTDFGSLGDTDARGLRATYYFGGVDDSAGPLALAPFLNKSSSATLEVHQETSDLGGLVPIGSIVSIGNQDEMQSYGLGGRYVWRSGWFAGGRFDSGDADPEPTLFTSRDVELLHRSVFVGKYLTDSLHVDVTLRSDETKTVVTSFGCISIVFAPCLAPFGERTRLEEYSIGSMFVARRRDLSFALSGRIASSRSEREFFPTAPATTLQPPANPIPFNYGAVAVLYPVAAIALAPPQMGRSKTYSVAGELFPAPSLGIRLDVTRWDGNTTQNKRYALSTTWFVRRNVALRFLIGRERLELPIVFDDPDVAQMTVLSRF